jgi:hypothetical protein
MAGRQSHYSYWGTLPQFREDGTRWRHRIDYERIPIPHADDIEWDLTLEACWCGDYAKRLAARKRMWRRIRTGYYANGKHSRKPTPKPDVVPAERPRCGARCRSGHPCRRRVIKSPLTVRPARRCKLHGGASTGPKTPEGRAASLSALARGRATRSRGANR